MVPAESICMKLINLRAISDALGTHHQSISSVGRPCSWQTKKNVGLSNDWFLDSFFAAKVHDLWILASESLCAASLLQGALLSRLVKANVRVDNYIVYTSWSNTLDFHIPFRLVSVPPELSHNFGPCQEMATPLDSERLQLDGTPGSFADAVHCNWWLHIRRRRQHAPCRRHSNIFRPILSDTGIFEQEWTGIVCLSSTPTCANLSDILANLFEAVTKLSTIRHCFFFHILIKIELHHL